MMKNSILYIIGIFIIFIVSSCEQEEVQTTFSTEKTLQLTFNMKNNGSRVVESDDVESYENKVTRADVFFFVKNNDNTYTYKFHELGLVPTTPTKTQSDGYWRMTVNVSIPDGVTFNGETYMVYVMANNDVATDVSTDTDENTNGLLDNINAIIANKGTALTFGDLEGAFSFTSSLETLINENTRFIMDGKNEITISNKNKVDGEIPLTRAAAKVMLDLSVYNEIQIGEKTYTPQTAEDAILLSYYNGLKTFNKSEVERFNATNWAGMAAISAGGASSFQVAFDPFYSYPTEWVNSDEYEPYLMLEIKWGIKVDDGDPTYEPYYYKIPVNRKFVNDEGKLCLLRNNLYKLILKVGVLGSTDPNEPVELNSEYEVMDWGDLAINTAVQNFKYLVVDQSEISIYNVSDAQITFASSHDVTVTVDRIEYKYYGKATTRTVTITSSRKSVSPTLSGFSDNNVYADYKIQETDIDANTSGLQLSKDAGVIDFSHTIKANTYTPHDIYVTVKHKDDTSGEYSQQVKITQYPPIYIVGDKSNGKVFVNEKAFSGSSDRVYAYDDRGNNNNYNIGSIVNPSDDNISGDDDAVNENQNLYNVYVTSLPDNNYMIGDPRVAVGGTLPYINELNNYRPTREGAENVIAPAFKIASSYGKTTDLSTYAAAERRCASYQENGYPAGRWRVPTAAEIAFIQERSKNGDIPSLFNGANNGNNWNPKYSGYWAAYQKAYWPGYLTNSQTSYGPSAGAYETDDLNCDDHAVRCVYDVWYWGDENTGQMADTYDDDYQLTNPVWGDTESVIEK